MNLLILILIQEQQVVVEMDISGNIFIPETIEIIKFESINFIPVPKDWFTNTNYDQIRNHASTGGQIKVVTITNRGESVGVRNRVYTTFPSVEMELVQSVQSLPTMILKLNLSL